MPAASNYTSKRRVAAQSKNVKAIYPGAVAQTTPMLQAACGLNTSFAAIDYLRACKCQNVAIE
jgi:hypothetical protein